MCDGDGEREGGDRVCDGDGEKEGRGRVCDGDGVVCVWRSSSRFFQHEERVIVLTMGSRLRSANDLLTEMHETPQSASVDSCCN